MLVQEHTLRSAHLSLSLSLSLSHAFLHEADLRVPPREVASGGTGRRRTILPRLLLSLCFQGRQEQRPHGCAENTCTFLCLGLMDSSCDIRGTCRFVGAVSLILHLAVVFFPLHFLLVTRSDCGVLGPLLTSAADTSKFKYTAGSSVLPNNAAMNEELETAMKVRL